ncbi:MAG: DUF167 domain-containing protein [Betaproteobacteria bacterium]|nr:DUF167 domain-containing protein [Betaproteobacteria bacterium]
MKPWLRRSEGSDAGLLLTLHIQPGAKKTEISGEHGAALKIRLAAPPVGGKANAALLAFIAARLQVPKAAVELKSGHASRQKIVLVRAALDADVVLARLS